jgi:hypothetical protein
LAKSGSKVKYNLPLARTSRSMRAPSRLLMPMYFSSSHSIVVLHTAHAIERLLLHACEKAGYKWLKVSQLKFCDAPETVVAINNSMQFDHFVSEHMVEIL